MYDIPLLTDKEMGNLGKSLQNLVRKKSRKTRLPFVTLKFAQTLDGKIATITGDSKWISGPTSLRFAHQLRSFHDAILVGVDTILQDDPQLTVRLVKGKNPQRIIVDSQLRTPLDSNILKGKAAFSTFIATTSLSEVKKIKEYQSNGAQVWVLKKDRANQVDLQNLLHELGKRDVRSVLVEGGSRILSSFLKKRLADHLVIVIAPKIIGKGMNYVDVSTLQRFKNLNSFSSPKLFRSGEDVILEAFLKE